MVTIKEIREIFREMLQEHEPNKRECLQNKKNRY